MFDWRDYLSLARFLIQNASYSGTEEAAQRSAVSRAYYATFCLTRAWAATKTANPFHVARRSADHGALRDWLRRNGKHNEAQVLDQLRDWRNQCDYDDSPPLPLQAVSALTIEMVEQTLQSIGIR